MSGALVTNIGEDPIRNEEVVGIISVRELSALRERDKQLCEIIDRQRNRADAAEAKIGIERLQRESEARGDAAVIANLRGTVEELQNLNRALLKPRVPGTALYDAKYIEKIESTLSLAATRMAEADTDFVAGSEPKISSITDYLPKQIEIMGFRLYKLTKRQERLTVILAETGRAQGERDEARRNCERLAAALIEAAKHGRG